MNSESERRDREPPLEQRCAETLARLCRLYGWRMPGDRENALQREVMAVLHAAADVGARQIEQACCRVYFQALFAGLDRGGEAAEQSMAELFSVVWLEEGASTTVSYGGYLFRSALTTLRRRLAGSAVSSAEIEQIGADAAARALTTVRTHFRDCRDPAAFWGWTSRVAERATIDELRSGRTTGGSSVRTIALDEPTETARSATSAASHNEAEERQVDVLSVRQELLRKCRLGKLSIDQREALVRSFWGEEKPAEIAAALTHERKAPVTAAQVSLWKHRGLQIMEANLRERGFE